MNDVRFQRKHPMKPLFSCISAQRRTVIAPLPGTGFRQLFFVLPLLVCPFGGHRHFMPPHYWLKRCNCLLKFATC